MDKKRIDFFIDNIVFTKNEINRLAREKADKVLAEAKTDPLRFYISIKATQMFLDEMLNHFKKPAIEEAGKYSHNGKINSELNGVNFEIKHSAKRFDYSESKKWTELIEKIDGLNKERKKLESFLQNLDKPVADYETGELLQPAKQISGGEDSITITFPKDNTNNI